MPCLAMNRGHSCGVIFDHRLTLTGSVHNHGASGPRSPITASRYLNANAFGIPRDLPVPGLRCAAQGLCPRGSHSDGHRVSVFLPALSKAGGFTPRRLHSRRPDSCRRDRCRTIRSAEVMQQYLAEIGTRQRDIFDVADSEPGKRSRRTASAAQFSPQHRAHFKPRGPQRSAQSLLPW